jgi:hypothetical protein
MRRPSVRCRTAAMRALVVARCARGEACRTYAGIRTAATLHLYKLREACARKVGREAGRLQRA